MGPGGPPRGLARAVQERGRPKRVWLGADDDPRCEPQRVKRLEQLTRREALLDEASARTGTKQHRHREWPSFEQLRRRCQPVERVVGLTAEQALILLVIRTEHGDARLIAGDEAIDD